MRVSGRQGAVIDLETPAGPDGFANLAAGAQVIVLERGGPLCGQTGWVRADAPATDLTLQTTGRYCLDVGPGGERAVGVAV